jgi:hypothetical protein
VSTRGPLDVDRVREALSLVEQGEVNGAVDLLKPLVPSRRSTRSSGRIPEPLEMSEVKVWLGSALADPTSDDARYFVERAYYKLRRYRQTD